MLDLIYTILLSLGVIYMGHRIYSMISKYFTDRSTSYVSFVETNRDRTIMQPQTRTKTEEPDGKQMFDELVDFVSSDTVTVEPNVDKRTTSTIPIETTSLETLPFNNNIDTS